MSVPRALGHDPHATAFGEKVGARIVTEGARDGHTGSVNAGRRLLAGEGRGGMITLPGDIPAVRASEIDAVLSAHLAAPSFTISPAHDDLGSNAVVCSQPESVPLRFGVLFKNGRRRRPTPLPTGERLTEYAAT